jgi:general secretion pathway protein G
MQGLSVLAGHCRKKASGESGFSLVDVSIAIVLLTALAIVVVLAVQGLGGLSEVASCQSDFKTVQTASEAFKAQTGAHPGGTYKSGVTVTAASASPRGENNVGILDLLGTASGASTSGPWLKGYPYRPGLYQIEVRADGSGFVSVHSTSSDPVQIGSTGTTNDCASVR